MRIVNGKLVFSKDDVYEFTQEESDEIDECFETYLEQDHINLYDEPLEDEELLNNKQDDKQNL